MLDSIINQENPCQYKHTFTDSFHWTHLTQYSEEKKQYYQDTFARELYLCHNTSQYRYATTKAHKQALVEEPYGTSDLCKCEAVKNSKQHPIQIGIWSTPYTN